MITPIALTDLFLWPPDRIAWTAHLFKTCREAFTDHKLLIDGVPEFRKRVKKIYEANGEESIELLSGARIDYLARSKGGGRGLGGKRVVFDEALFGTVEQAGAMLPILAARDDPQVNYSSSAAKAESDLLRALTTRGRAGDDPSIILVEFCAPGSWRIPGCEQGPACQHVLGVPGCRLDDEDYWRAANPAMATGRIGIEFMRAMRRSLDPLEFGREFLGWDEYSDDEALRPIKAEDWAATAADVRPTGRAHFFVDVQPGMVSASIAIAANPRAIPLRDLPHVELAECLPGTDWVVRRASELAARYPGAAFGADAASAVGALLPDLERAGVEVELLTNREMGQACQHLQKLAADRVLTHSDDPKMRLALAGAVKRDVGDGLWAWGRRRSTSNISPLVAATGALWLLEKHRDSDGDPLASIW